MIFDLIKCYKEEKMGFTASSEWKKLALPRIMIISPDMVNGMRPALQ